MKATIFTFSLLAFGCSLGAQTSLNTSGGVALSSSGTVAYSLGQAFQDTPSNGLVSVSQGVQQPYEITQTLGIDISEISLNVKVFPNPTQDFLNLRVDFSDYSKYTYSIYDSSDKLILAGKVSSRDTVLRVSSYPAGLYYVKVIKSGKPLKVFKVIKTDK